jgi:mannose-6-phosphate isomerase-like protein (cupin superfamily)
LENQALGRQWEIDAMSNRNHEATGNRRPFVGLANEREPVPGIPIIIRAGAEETGGGFEVYEIGVPDQHLGLGAGPPPHVHREHEEAFYILDGEFTFTLGSASAAAPEGTLIVVPRGTRHHFVGKAGSRALVLAVPGGLAGFFQELGAGIATGRADAELRAALAGKYDSYPEIP